MPKFSRLFWWLIVVGAVLSMVAVAVANHVADSRFANYIGIIAVLVNLCGFVLISEQLRATNRSTENQTRWEIEQVSFNVYKMLVDRPSLRKYFYDGTPLPSDEPTRSRVEAACELLLDYFETIVGSSTVLDDTSESVWNVYMKKIYGTSPALAAFLNRECERYTPALIALLDPRLSQSLRDKGLTHGTGRARSSTS